MTHMATVQTTELFLDPCDVLLFRDGRPFSAGSEHTARCLFPPLPGTVYGAVRSALLQAHGVDFDRFASCSTGDEPWRGELGSPSQPGSMRLTRLTVMDQPVAGRWREFVPWPADTVMSPEGTASTMAPLGEPSVFSGNLPSWLRPVWLAHDQVLGKETPDPMSLDLLAALLNGDQEAVRRAWLAQRDDRPPAVDREPRTGIMRQADSRTVERGMLYTVEYKRLRHDQPARPVGFGVRLEGVTWNDRVKFLRLGGDSRTVSVQTRPSQGPGLPRVIPSHGRLKVVLLTPALFGQGWLPAWIDAQTGRGRWAGLDLRLVGIRYGRPLGVGGYDLAANRPKAMRPAVPAGSVMFFEIEGGSPEPLKTCSSISDERAHEGFGIYATGGFDYV